MKHLLIVQIVAVMTTIASANTLTLEATDPHALVRGDSAEIIVRSTAEAGDARTIELVTTGWRGDVLHRVEVTMGPGSPEQSVTVQTPRYGPYFISAREPETSHDAAALTLIRALESPRLDQATRSASWIGLNIHHEPPWGAMGRLGIHWARGYTWGRMHADRYPYEYDDPPTYAEYRRLWDAADAAGVTIMPCMQFSFYAEDEAGWSNDPDVVIEGYAELATAFPEVEVWELDNEPALRFRDDVIDMDNYRRYIELAHAGLSRVGDAKLALYGTPGILLGEATLLLETEGVEPVVRDDFDVISYHYYTGNLAPEHAKVNMNYAVQEEGYGHGALLDLQRQMNQLAHAAGKEAWLTEIGWDVYFGHGAVGEHLQATYLPRVFLLSRLIKTDKVFWYFDRDVPGMHRKFGSCGIFDEDYDARASAATMAALSYFTGLAEPGGSIDLGRDAWAVVLERPEGGFVIAAWTKQQPRVIPAELESTEAYDQFGNPLDREELTPEVAYFQITQLPDHWEQQRKVAMLSDQRLLLEPGMAERVVIEAPGATALSFEGPEGVDGEWRQEGAVWVGQLAASATVTAGWKDVAVRVTGDGWERRLYLQVEVSPAIEVDAAPVASGEAATIRLLSRFNEARGVSLQVGEQQLSIALAGKGSEDVELPAMAGAGPWPLVVSPAGAASQTYWLRPATLDLPEAKDASAEGQPPKQPATLPREAMSPTPGDDVEPMAVWLSWSDAGLHVTAALPAPLRDATNPRDFWEWTNLEVFLAPDESGAQGWPDSARQFYFVSTRNGGEEWQLIAGEWNRRAEMTGPTFDDPRLPTAIEVSDDRAILEAFIPTAALPDGLEAGSNWRLAVSVQLASETRRRRSFSWPIAKDGGLLSGVESWGIVHLAH